MSDGRSLGGCILSGSFSGDPMASYVSGLFEAAPLAMSADDLSPLVPTDANGLPEPTDGQFDEGAASPDDNLPIDIASLDPTARKALDDWYERNVFVTHKRNIQQALGSQIQTAIQQRDQAMDEVDAKNAWQQNAMQWLQGYIQALAQGKRTPDYRDVSDFLVSVSQRRDGQVSNSWRQAYDADVEKDLAGHKTEISSRAFVGEGEQRRQVFDPNHPEIVQALSTYFNALKEYHRKPRDAGLYTDANNKFNQYQRTIDRIENQAKLRLVARTRAIPASETQNQLALQGQRGPVDRGRGGGAAAPRSFDDFHEAAKQEYAAKGINDQERIFVRALTMEQEALQQQRR